MSSRAGAAHCERRLCVRARLPGPGGTSKFCSAPHVGEAGLHPLAGCLPRLGVSELGPSGILALPPGGAAGTCPPQCLAPPVVAGAGLTFTLASSSPLLPLSFPRGSPGDALEMKHRRNSFQDEEPHVAAPTSSERTAGFGPSTGPKSRPAGLRTPCPVPEPS